jgi:hypothetical protein
MTIRDLTDEQLERWIAEKGEPDPGALFSNEAKNYFVIIDFPSNGKFWTYTRPQSYADMPQPRKFCSDWNACGMLLEQMSSCNIYNLGKLWSFYLQGEPFFKVHHEDLKRAICESWALSQGWTDTAASVAKEAHE